jgi:hypothetical protein
MRLSGTGEAMDFRGVDWVVRVSAERSLGETSELQMISIIMRWT